EQKACVVLTVLGLIATLACAATPWAGPVAIAAVAGIVVLNHGFFEFLVRRKGLTFACASLPLQLIYYSCCAFSVVIAEAHWYFKSHDKGVIRSTRPGRAHHGAAQVAGPAAARRASRWRARSRLCSRLETDEITS